MRRRFTVTVTFNQAQAEQIGSLAAGLGVPVTTVVKLAALCGLGQTTSQALEAAQQSGEVRATGERHPWPGLGRKDDKSHSGQRGPVGGRAS